MAQGLSQHNSESYHYAFVGFSNFKKVYQALAKGLPYYRFEKETKRHSKEIFYDIQSHLLADAGIAISKWMEDGESSLNIRKMFNELKKPSQKYLFGYCKNDEQPKDYSYQMAGIIEGTFRTPFSADLESIIKQTSPIIEVDITSDKYRIICGTGYRAIMQYENTVYKDLKTGKKVERVGMTFKFPIGECEEKQEILNAIDRHVKGLAINNISRFEIACKLLFAKPQQIVEEPAQEEGSEEEDK